jgi:hypothetical protein
MKKMKRLGFTFREGADLQDFSDSGVYDHANDFAVTVDFNHRILGI